MTNLRKETRKQPITYMEAYDSETGKFLGKVVDVNRGGIRLFSERDFAVGTVYEMRLPLHEKIKGVGDVCFEGICRWRDEYAHGLLSGSIAAGFRYGGMTPQDRETLEAMLASPWFRDWRQLPDYAAIRAATEEAEREAE